MALSDLPFLLAGSYGNSKFACKLDEAAHGDSTIGYFAAELSATGGHALHEHGQPLDPATVGRYNVERERTPHGFDTTANLAQVMRKR